MFQFALGLSLLLLYVKKENNQAMYFMAYTEFITIIKMNLRLGITPKI